MSSRPAWGKGRIDPQNPFKFTTLEQPIDSTIGNADMTPLWNMKARRGMALHWDGMNTIYREVLLSSGLGNGATVRSIEVENIDRLGAWFDDLQPPPFPFPIDRALAKQGQEVYDKTCVMPCRWWRAHRPGHSDRGGRHRPHRARYRTAPSPRRSCADEKQPWQFTHFRRQRHGGESADGMVEGTVSAQRIGSLAHRSLEPAAQRPARFYRGYDVFGSCPGRLRVVRARGGARRVSIRRDAARQWQRGTRVRRRAVARSEARARGVHEDALTLLVTFGVQAENSCSSNRSTARENTSRDVGTASARSVTWPGLGPPRRFPLSRESRRSQGSLPQMFWPMHRTESDNSAGGGGPWHQTRDSMRRARIRYGTPFSAGGSRRVAAGTSFGRGRCRLSRSSSPSRCRGSRRRCSLPRPASRGSPSTTTLTRRPRGNRSSARR